MCINVYIKIICIPICTHKDQFKLNKVKSSPLKGNDLKLNEVNKNVGNRVFIGVMGLFVHQFVHQ